MSAVTAAMEYRQTFLDQIYITVAVVVAYQTLVQMVQAVLAVVAQVQIQ
jgi:hypothetical protein